MRAGAIYNIRRETGSGAPTPVDFSPRRARLALVALLIAVVLLTGCGAGARPQSRATATLPPSPTPTVPATPEGHLTLLVRQAVGAAAKLVTVAYSPADKLATVDVTLVWSPAWKTDFALGQAAAKLACYQTQAALWTSGIPLSKVIVIVLGQALDDYASVIQSAYAEADIVAAHASAITWATITADQAWARYDNEFLRPTYAPNWVYLPGR